MDLTKLSQMPREQWPKFLREAAERAEREGKSIRQVLDEDVERLRSTPVPDDDGS